MNNYQTPCRTAQVYAALLFLIGLTASVLAETATFWPRDNIAYLCREAAVPVWIKLPSDSLTMAKPLELKITMPAGFMVTAYGSSTQFAMQPVPISVPTSMNSQIVNSDVVCKIMLPTPASAGNVRVAVLITPGSADPSSYSVKLDLKTQDGSYTWPTYAATAKVLESLGKNRPEQIQISVFDYADYANSEYKSGMVELFGKSGFNYIHNMNYYSSTTTIAQQLRSNGVKAGCIWWWQKHAYGITSVYPQARRLDMVGVPIIGSLCYAWCIQNPLLAKDALVDYLTDIDTPDKYDCIFIDNEEKALDDSGNPQGDLYTPLTLEAFRAFAGIPSSVTLSPAVIKANYPNEWIDYRCWECAQMAMILGQAVKQYDPQMDFGIYSGYEYTGQYEGFSKQAYSMDWNLMQANPYIDFGCAGYYGTAYVASTAAAIYPKNMMPGVMYMENFYSTSVPPTPDEFAFRLMQETMLAGAKGGFAIWYGQVLDGAAFSAVSSVAGNIARIEDILVNGTRCDSQLTVSGISSSYVYAYELSADRKAVVVLNPEYSSKQISITWNQMLPDLITIDLAANQSIPDPAAITKTMPARSYSIFLTQTPAPQACGDPGTVYLTGDINKDCLVDENDLLIFLSSWLMNEI